jgi:F0F1-type ATP synthase membrane subunit c/vacuolar-type H+-ATPase subunit K
LQLQTRRITLLSNKIEFFFIIRAGLATIGLISAGVEKGVVFGELIIGVSRNPSLKGQLFYTLY